MLKNEYRFLFFYTKAKLEAESFRHFAGYFWWLLDPVLSLFIYYFVFKVVMHRGGPDYAPFLFIGLLTWKWFRDVVGKSSGALLSNLGLIKRVRIKKYVFPTVEFMRQSWKFIFIFIPLVLIYPILGFEYTLSYLWVPLILLVQGILSIGIGYFFCSLIPFIPDIDFIIKYGLRLMFYPSGVLFSLSIVPDKYQWVIKMNPMAGIIQSYRDAVMYNTTPSFFGLMYPFVLGALFMIAGLWIMKKYDQEYPKLT